METDKPVQWELFDIPQIDSEKASIGDKSYQEQQKVIDKPIDYVSRKAIELRPLDFLQFFSEFQSVTPEEQKQIRVLDANRTLEAYFKREADSLSLIIDSNLPKLKDTAFHIEIQTAYEEMIDERLLVYQVLILHKTKKKRVKTLLINLDSNAKSQQLGSHDFGSVKIQYQVKNLWEQDYEALKQRVGLLPFTPYLKGGGPQQIKEASEQIQQQIDDPTERAEMLFLLAILAGRKYNTAGFQLLSPLVTMNIQTLKDDPTAKELIHLLFPNELAQAEQKGEARGEAKGIEKGIEMAKKNFLRQLQSVQGVLSDAQIQQLLR
jgi:predicted transposase YdaD